MGGAALLAGAAISIGGQLYSGYQQNKLAKKSADNQEEIAKAQYNLTKQNLIGTEDAPGTVEQLHNEEKEAYGSLLSGAAASGVKVEQFDRPERLSAEERISVEEGKTHVESIIPEVEAATDTIGALRNKITTTYNSAEESIYQDLAMSKLGLKSALYNAEVTRNSGQAALWGGILGAGGTLLTSYGLASTPKNQGGWGIFS